MARTYRRDARGRFAGTGSTGSARRQLRSKVGGTVTADRLKRNAATGTAKPAGTISGSRYGRQVDQFSRDMQAMTGRKVGAKVKRQAPSLMEQAKASGVRIVKPKAGPARVLKENTFGTTAPRGTIPKRDPAMAIFPSDRTRRTAVRAESSRPARRSKATAAKAEAAGGVLVRGEYRKLKRSKRSGTLRR